MKKIILVFLAIVLLAAVAFAGGSSVFWQSITLYSAATNTIGAVTGTPGQFDNPIDNLACTVTSTPTTSVILQINGDVTLNRAFDANGIISASTCTTPPCYMPISTGKPLREVVSIVTSSITTTAVVTVTCVGSQ